jgi:hypothetical protein
MLVWIVLLVLMLLFIKPVREGIFVAAILLILRLSDLLDKITGAIMDWWLDLCDKWSER